MDSASQRCGDLKQGVEALLQDVGGFLGQLVQGNDAVGGTSSAAIDSEIGNNFRQYSALRARHHDASLSVAVLALTKSGPMLWAAASGCQFARPCHLAPPRGTAACPGTPDLQAGQTCPWCSACVSRSEVSCLSSVVSSVLLLGPVVVSY